MSDKAKKRRLDNTTVRALAPHSLALSLTHSLTHSLAPPLSQVACPIVFGSIAFWMGKKAAEHATHRWSLFVRGPNDEDLSSFVSKVIFSLHPSFAVPLRGE
jgi:hypothetical protein